jgi:hypothetical protein
MHICTRCRSPLVQPTDWYEEDSEGWFVVLRCPDCELLRGAVFDDTAVEAFDVELDRGTEVLEEELAALTRESMREYATGFIYALAGDHIEPMDF